MGLGTFVKNIQKLGTKDISVEKGLSYSGYPATTNLNTFSSTFVMDGVPVYTPLTSKDYLLKCYESNPIVQSVINIKANAFSNMRFIVRDLKSGEETPLVDYEKDGGKLRELLTNPNALQSTYEFLRQFKINFEVFGNGYMYAFVPTGYENTFSYDDINVINNLNSGSIRPVLTGNWLRATTREEVIKEYQFTSFNNKLEHLPPSTVFHLNNANIRLDANFTEGVSDLLALKHPISNIDGAYESRNVMIRKRGALGILSPESVKDEAVGAIPLTDEEIERNQIALQKYGGLSNQYQHIISPNALKYQKMAMSVKELMLFEEIEADAIAVANAKGVPELLVKYYIKGGTFENLDKSEKRLYDSTIIPESIEFLTSFNSFLKTNEQGIQLLGSFDHVKCLQINKKEEAETDKIKEQTAYSAFMIGAIDYGTYQQRSNMPIDEDIKDLRIWDLDKERISVIKNKATNDGERN